MPEVYTFKKSFPERLKKLLKESGYKQSDFLQDFRTPDGEELKAATLQSWLYSGKVPDISTIEALCKFFDDCSADYILGQSDYKTHEEEAAKKYVNNQGLNLTEESVSTLIKINQDAGKLAVLNHLLRKDGIIDSIIMYYLSFVGVKIETSEYYSFVRTGFLNGRSYDQDIHNSKLLRTLPDDRQDFIDRCDSEMTKRIMHDFVKHQLGKDAWCAAKNWAYKQKSFAEKEYEKQTAMDENDKMAWTANAYKNLLNDANNILQCFENDAAPDNSQTT